MQPLDEVTAKPDMEASGVCGACYDIARGMSPELTQNSEDPQNSFFGGEFVPFICQQVSVPHVKLQKDFSTHRSKGLMENISNFEQLLP